MLRRLLASGVILAAASTAWAGQLLTPAGWGGVAGTGAWEAGEMFDVQPTWNGTALSGGDFDYNSSLWTPWDGAGATAFIDFGADYASIRIEQLWTLGMAWRTSGGFPSPEVWWDSDATSSAMPVGANVADTINFNTKGSLGTLNFVWQQDFDYTANPVTPAARYLKLRLPVQGAGVDITATTELAIIGTVAAVPEPASMGALGGMAVLIMRRRR